MTIFRPVQEPFEPVPLPEGRTRRVCASCNKRRQCGQCVSCEEWYCSECSAPLKDKPKSWFCDGCRSEAAECRQWGLWGPP